MFSLNGVMTYFKHTQLITGVESGWQQKSSALQVAISLAHKVVRERLEVVHKPLIAYQPRYNVVHRLVSVYG